ncbi:MAG: M50 family metallopeptidase [Candidatus Aenigmatarchaeota archaeon]
MLFLVPLAFVEPDEKALVKRPAWQQLRIFAVGSFGNFVLAGISLAVLFLFMVSMYVPGGVSYSAYIPGYPAEQVNLTGVIRSMDGFQIRNITDLSLALEEIGPGKEIAIGTRVYYDNYTYDDLTYTLTTAQDNETGAGFIGISFNPASVNFYELQPSLWDWRHQIDFLEGLFQWLFIINLGVGSVNLLPIGPLDGGRMWQLVFKRLSKKRWKFIANAVSKVTLALLVLNFAVPILRSALGI